VHELRQYIGGAEQTLFELENRGLILSHNGYRLLSSAFASWIVGEIKTSLIEPREYEDWLRSHEAQSGILKLSKHLADEVKIKVLPQVAAKYRELVIAWLADPRTISSAIALLRSALGNR